MSFLNPLAAAPIVARSFFTPPSVTSTGGAAAWFAAQRSDDWSDGAGRGDVDSGDIDTQRAARGDLRESPIEALDGPLGRLDTDADVRTDVSLSATARTRTGDALSGCFGAAA